VGSNRNRIHAFTLVEALVAAALVGLGIASVLGGISALMRAESKALEAEELQRFAHRKFQEFGTVVDPSAAEDSGTFEEEGRPDVAWSATVETTEVESLLQVSVTTNKGLASQTISGLVADPSGAATTTGATP